MALEIRNMLMSPAGQHSAVPATGPGKLWLFRVPGFMNQHHGIIVRVSEARTREQIALLNLLHLQDPEEVKNLQYGTMYLIECKESQCGCYVQGEILEFCPTPENPVGYITVQYANCAKVCFGIYGGCFCGAKMIDLQLNTAQQFAQCLESAPGKARVARRILMATAAVGLVGGAIGAVSAMRGAVAASHMGLGEDSERCRQEIMGMSSSPLPVGMTKPASAPQIVIATTAMPTRPALPAQMSAPVNQLTSQTSGSPHSGKKALKTVTRKTDATGTVTITTETVDSQGNKVVEVKEEFSSSVQSPPQILDRFAQQDGQTASIPSSPPMNVITIPVKSRQSTVTIPNTKKQRIITITKTTTRNDGSKMIEVTKMPERLDGSAGLRTSGDSSSAPSVPAASDATSGKENAARQDRSDSQTSSSDPYIPEHLRSIRQDHHSNRDPDINAASLGVSRRHQIDP